MTEAPPPPGSPEAYMRGCTCPVLDNGEGADRPVGSYCIAADCPLHAAPTEEGVETPEPEPEPEPEQ